MVVVVHARVAEWSFVTREIQSKVTREIQIFFTFSSNRFKSIDLLGLRQISMLRIIWQRKREGTQTTQRLVKRQILNLFLSKQDLNGMAWSHLKIMQNILCSTSMSKGFVFNKGNLLLAGNDANFFKTWKKELAHAEEMYLGIC